MYKRQIQADGEERELTPLALLVTDKKLLPLFEDVQAVKDADGAVTGLLVSSCAEMMDEGGEIIPGLYAAGAAIEAGVHGENPLPGNEMTAMIVFGTTAGTESAIYISDNQ